MRSTRRSQPYRKGHALRRHGRALSAMTRGRTLYGKNPQDARRLFKKRAGRRRRKSVRKST